VESIDIIGPYDSDKVKIQQGKDMITLLTCHPYRSHGKQRYVVYCVREGTEKTEDTTYDTEQNQTTETFVSSEPDIEREDRLRVAAGILIVLMCAATILSKRRR
jgi:sortase A